MFKKLIFFPMLALMASCGSNSTEPTTAPEAAKTDSAQNSAATSPENEEAELMFTTMVLNIPSPFDIVSKIPRAGLQFDASLANSVDNSLKYISSVKKGMNYGGYLVDLVYVSTNKQFEQIKPYFKTTRALAKSLDCAESFDKIAGARLEKNIDKEDTINKVIIQIYSEMDNYLRSNDRLLTSIEIVVGSWIESQYLTLSLIKNTEVNANNDVLFKKVSQEKQTLEKLIDLLKDQEKEKEFAPLIKDIKDIHEIYVKDVKFNDISKEAVLKLYTKVQEARMRMIS
jgi:hypothetical protein